MNKKRLAQVAGLTGMVVSLTPMALLIVFGVEGVATILGWIGWV